MTLDEMLSELTMILQDSSFDNNLLTADLDEALLDTATLIKLPALQSSDTITTLTDDYQVPMPESYHRDLYLVEQPDLNYRPIEILINLKSLDQHRTTRRAGKAYVRWCCEQNDIFYYHPIPETSQDLTAFFYAKPESLVDDDEAHLVIPANLHFQVLVCAVAAKRFALIEDGMDGQKVNTAFYQQETIKGLAKLMSLYPDAPRKPFRPVRRVSYF